MRLRGIYYDDKNGVYVVYVDYIYPHHGTPLIDIERACYELGDGVVAEDGQVYNWDILSIEWVPDSDHADKDHYDYYEPHAYHMRYGRPRNRMRAPWRPGENRLPSKSDAISGLATALGALQCVSHVLQVSDCTIERLYQLHRGENWREMLIGDGTNADRLLSSEILLEVADFAAFVIAMESLPTGVEKHFSVSRRLVFTPDGFSAEDDKLFALKLSLHDCLCTTPWEIRKHLDEYARELTVALKSVG